MLPNSVHDPMHSPLLLTVRNMKEDRNGERRGREIESRKMKKVQEMGDGDTGVDVTQG